MGKDGSCRFCGRNNSALMLVADDYRSNINDVIAKKSSSIDRLYFFGGPAAVSDDVYRSMVNALAYWLCNEVCVSQRFAFGLSQSTFFEIRRQKYRDSQESMPLVTNRPEGLFLCLLQAPRTRSHEQTTSVWDSGYRSHDWMFGR